MVPGMMRERSVKKHSSEQLARNEGSEIEMQQALEGTSR
jgi:hypothetical protein